MPSVETAKKKRFNPKTDSEAYKQSVTARILQGKNEVDIAEEDGIHRSIVNRRLKPTGTTYRQLEGKIYGDKCSAIDAIFQGIIKEHTTDVPPAYAKEWKGAVPDEIKASELDEFMHVCRIVYLEALKGTSWVAAEKKHKFSRRLVMPAYDLVLPSVTTEKKKMAIQMRPHLDTFVVSDQDRTVFEKSYCEWKHVDDVAKEMSTGDKEVKIHNVDFTISKLCRLFPSLKGAVARIKPRREGRRLQTDSERNAVKESKERHIRAALLILPENIRGTVRSRLVDRPAQAEKVAKEIAQAYEKVLEWINVLEIPKIYHTETRQACISIESYYRNPGQAVLGLHEMTQELDRNAEAMELPDKTRRVILRKISNQRFLSVEPGGYALAYSALEERIANVAIRRDLILETLEPVAPPSSFYDRAFNKFMFQASTDIKILARDLTGCIDTYQRIRTQLSDQGHHPEVAAYIASFATFKKEPDKEIKRVMEQIIQKALRTRTIEAALNIFARRISTKRVEGERVRLKDGGKLDPALEEIFKALLWNKFDPKDTRRRIMHTAGEVVRDVPKKLYPHKGELKGLGLYCLIAAKASRATVDSAQYLGVKQKARATTLHHNAHRLISTARTSAAPKKIAGEVSRKYRLLHDAFSPVIKEQEKDVSITMRTLMPLVHKIANTISDHLLTSNLFLEVLGAVCIEELDAIGTLELDPEVVPKAISIYPCRSIKILIDNYGKPSVEQAIKDNNDATWFISRAVDTRRLAQYFSAVLFQGEEALSDKEDFPRLVISVSKKQPFGIAPNILSNYREIYEYLADNPVSENERVRNEVAAWAACISPPEEPDVEKAEILARNYLTDYEHLKEEVGEIQHVASIIALKSMLYKRDEEYPQGILPHIKTVFEAIRSQYTSQHIGMFIASRSCVQANPKISAKNYENKIIASATIKTAVRCPDIEDQLPWRGKPEGQESSESRPSDLVSIEAIVSSLSAEERALYFDYIEGRVDQNQKGIDEVLEKISGS